MSSPFSDSKSASVSASSSVPNEEFVLDQRPQGINDLGSTWKLQDCPMPVIDAKTPDGQFITESLYISVDPYLSSQIKASALGGQSMAIGTVQQSSMLSRVIQSTHVDFPVGSYFEARVPWRRFNSFDKTAGTVPVRYKIVKKPGEIDTLFDKVGLSHSVGGLGMPSQTAFYGATEVLELKADDILVVSGAMGAVGSVLCQIAVHVLGVKCVIGIAGGENKIRRLSELGVPHVIDYKVHNTKEAMGKRILELTNGKPPNKYFDNTGGPTTDAFFDICARKSLIAICGQISSYNENDTNNLHYPNYLAKTIYKALRIQGFVWGDFASQNDQKFFPSMASWIQQGKIKFDQTLVEGFKNLPKAYKMLFTGENMGKLVVKV